MIFKIDEMQNNDVFIIRDRGKSFVFVLLKIVYQVGAPYFQKRVIPDDSGEIAIHIPYNSVGRQ